MSRPHSDCTRSDAAPSSALDRTVPAVKITDIGRIRRKGTAEGSICRGSGPHAALKGPAAHGVELACPSQRLGRTLFGGPDGRAPSPCRGVTKAARALRRPGRGTAPPPPRTDRAAQACARGCRLGGFRVCCAGAGWAGAVRGPCGTPVLDALAYAIHVVSRVIPAQYVMNSRNEGNRHIVIDQPRDRSGAAQPCHPDAAPAAAQPPPPRPRCARPLSCLTSCAIWPARPQPSSLCLFVAPVSYECIFRSLGL